MSRSQTIFNTVEKNCVLESDYLRVITSESLEKQTAYLAEIISITSNDSSFVQNDQERE